MDLFKKFIILVDLIWVWEVMFLMELGEFGVMIRIVEYLFVILVVLDIGDLCIEVNGLEVFLLDGFVFSWLMAIVKVGIRFWLKKS